jgi:hypothetical protein
LSKHIDAPVGSGEPDIELSECPRLQYRWAFD